MEKTATSDGFKRPDEILDENHTGSGKADYYIHRLHQHQVELIRAKGMKDWRVILVAAFGVLMTFAVTLSSRVSLLLILGALVAVYFGAKNHQKITLINLEIEATNTLLGELFRIKLKERFSSFYASQGSMPTDVDPGSADQ